MTTSITLNVPAGSLILDSVNRRPQKWGSIATRLNRKLDTTEDEKTILNHEQFQQQIPDWYPRIYRMIAAMTYGSGLDPEDLTQETFMKAYDKLSTFHAGSSMYTWLYQIARNTCRDAMRKVKVRRRFKKLVGKQEDEDELWEPPSPESLDDNMHRRESLQLLRKALAQLPEEPRALIVFKDLEEMSYQDIAGIYEIPEGTVKSRLFKARKQLKEQLEKLGYRHEK